MATEALTNSRTQSRQQSVTQVNQNDIREQDAEFNRFGLISVVILIVGCLGGVTVGMGAIEHLWSLVLVVVPTMTTLSLLLAVAPMRYIFYATTVSIVIDVLLLVYFLIV